MPASKKYSDERRERVTRMALDAAQDQRMLAIRQVPGQLDVYPEALPTWSSAPRSTPAPHLAFQLDDAARIVELEREVRELRAKSG